jgi:hypothetical protein
MAVAVHNSSSHIAHNDVENFGALYPMRSGMFRHDLCNHPLLTINALADAAMAMRPEHVEYRNSAGNGFQHINRQSINPDIIIRNIARHDCWMMLRFLEQLPEYRRLLEETLHTYAHIIEPQTGPMRDIKAFVFISATDVVTPFHFDPEYNILFHIAGNKSFATFPAAPPFLDEMAHERMHLNGDNLLQWDESYRASATDNLMGPGDALYIPYKMPHIVAVKGGPCISISMTWKSDWSLAQDQAHNFNTAMRQLGMRPQPVPDWPRKTPFRSISSRILQKIGLPR